MEYIKQSSDEVDIRGTESKYDSRKINSYPSKVGACLFFSICRFAVCCYAVRGAPPSPTTCASSYHRTALAAFPPLSRTTWWTRAAKAQKRHGNVYKRTEPWSKTIAMGLWCPCSDGGPLPLPCTRGSIPRRGLGRGHLAKYKGPHTQPVQPHIGMKCDPCTVVS